MFPYGLNTGPVLSPIGSRVFHKINKINNHKILKRMKILKLSEKCTMDFKWSSMRTQILNFIMSVFFFIAFNNCMTAINVIEPRALN